MKIQIVQDCLRSGGTERQTILLAHAFARAGQTVEVLTFRPGGALAETLLPIRHRALQPLDLGLDWFAPGLHRAVKKFSPDVVLCMGRMANSRAGAIKQQRRRDDPRALVIATMRTGKTLPRRFRDSLRVVDHVVSNSSDAARRLVSEYGVPQEKVSVIHNALVFPDRGLSDDGDDRREKMRRMIRAENGANENVLVFLCVAMFRPEKNQRLLVDLWAKFPGREKAQLWFVGEGPTRPDVQEYVRVKAVEESVKFFGFQADPERFYAGADIAVLASRSESLSNFLIEAHAHGLPSIAYDVMGVKECGGMAVPLGDEDAFVEKLQWLAHDASARARESARLQAYAREAFAPEKQAGEYLTLFERLRGQPVVFK
jgi:glycosyltransferase involved in cell wall biosynthesis